MGVSPSREGEHKEEQLVITEWEAFEEDMAGLHAAHDRANWRWRVRASHGPRMDIAFREVAIQMATLAPWDEEDHFAPGGSVQGSVETRGTSHCAPVLSRVDRAVDRESEEDSIRHNPKC